MKKTQILLMISSFDWRPSANKIPIGNDKIIPVIPMIRANMNPPNSFDGMYVREIGIKLSSCSATGLSKNDQYKTTKTKVIGTLNMDSLDRLIC